MTQSGDNGLHNRGDWLGNDSARRDCHSVRPPLSRSEALPPHCGLKLVPARASSQMVIPVREPPRHRYKALTWVFFCSWGRSGERAGRKGSRTLC